MLGKQNEKWLGTPDLTRSELAMVGILTFFMFLVGLWPNSLMATIHPASQALVDHVVQVTEDSGLSINNVAPAEAADAAPSP